MKFEENYTSNEKIKIVDKDTSKIQQEKDKEKAKIILSEDAFAIGFMLDEIVAQLRLIRNQI
jgi:hypothetical protein